MFAFLYKEIESYRYDTDDHMTKIAAMTINIYNGEIKMAMVGFEPTPTSTAAPSNTETIGIPSRPLRSLKNELSWPRFMLDFSALPYIHIHIYLLKSHLIYKYNTFMIFKMVKKR